LGDRFGRVELVDLLDESGNGEVRCGA
jgi:hypothetical protein